MKNREMSVSVTHFTKSPGHGLVADTIRQAGRRWTECTDNWKEDSNRNPKLSQLNLLSHQGKESLKEKTESNKEPQKERE